MNIFTYITPVAFNIGFISIYWYGISYVIGILLSFFLMQKIEKKYIIAKLKKSHFDDLMTYIILGILIGGRVGYILFYCPLIILGNFWEIFKIWHGGMSFHGGLVGVMIAVYIFCFQNHKNFISIMDLISCATPIGLFCGRIANFINAELYGRETSVPWAIVFPDIDSIPRHPSQLYEAFFEGIMLLALMLLALKTKYIFIIKQQVQKNRLFHLRGFLSGVFLLFYSIFRMSAEFFREPDAQIGYIYNFLTLGQVLCIPMLLLGIYLILNSIKDVRGNCFL